VRIIKIKLVEVSSGSKLSAKEQEAITAFHFGGFAGMRDKEAGVWVMPATMKSLIAKGYFDAKGLTEKGKAELKLIHPTKLSEESSSVADKFHIPVDATVVAINEERASWGVTFFLFSGRKSTAEYKVFVEDLADAKIVRAELKKIWPKAKYTTQKP
jgi:hypothetical protein